MGLQTNRCEFFLQHNVYSNLNIIYHGNSIPEWFTNRSLGENHVKAELPSYWSYDTFWGYGVCVVFKCKKPFKKFKGYSIKNFDGASLMIEKHGPYVTKEFLKKEGIGIHESYMIWLNYSSDTWGWKEAKNFVTFSFFEENNEDVEVKECGVRLICDEDLEQDVTNMNMFQDLPTPSQHGGAMDFYGPFGEYRCSW
ncbi:hypothetical protein Tco_0264293 [Tanacetum coccineum]